MSKVAVITGTSKGLGLAIAHMLLYNGWKVYGISRNSQSPTLPHDYYVHVQADVSNLESLAKGVASIKESIDLVIHNAAQFKMASLSDTSFTIINSIIDTNLKGPIFLTKLIKSKMTFGGKMIFINSVAGLNELENQSVYCASKFALTAFAGVVARELRMLGVKVTSIHPGGINTSLWNDSNPYPVGDKTQALDTQEITRTIEFILDAAENAEFKTIKLFPDIEWH